MDSKSAQVADPSSAPAISKDGRFVAFQSLADKLDPTPSVGSQIYVRDRMMGTTFRVSVNDFGVPGDGDSKEPSISYDGCRVAFTSLAKNLVAGKTTPHNDVYVRDWCAPTGNDKPPATWRVSVPHAAMLPMVEGDEASDQPAISGNGQVVAFRSRAANLVPGDVNLAQDIFVNEVGLLPATELVSINNKNEQGEAHSSLPSISESGQFVTFTTGSTNYDPPLPKPLLREVYLRDQVAGTTEMISLDNFGMPGNGDSFSSSISANGNRVAFSSTADNLDGAVGAQVYVRDRGGLPKTFIVSVNDAGIPSNNTSGVFNRVALSGDGFHVAFHSIATNLDVKTTAWNDIYARDLVAGKTRRVSLPDSTLAAKEGNDPSAEPAINFDGCFVAFQSSASNLVVADTNKTRDVFVHEQLMEDGRRTTPCSVVT